jgi:hypothetical protein
MEGKKHMNRQPNPATPDAESINQRVKTAVKAHGIKLRVLTTAAFTLGFVAIAASILIVTFYMKVYRHEQEWINAESLRPAEWAKVDTKHINGLLQMEAVQTSCLGAGVTGVAWAVIVLGLATLMLMAVVILNRRVALNQINDSLAQISKQLRELQTERGNT